MCRRSPALVSPLAGTATVDAPTLLSPLVDAVVTTCRTDIFELVRHGVEDEYEGGKIEIFVQREVVG